MQFQNLSAFILVILAFLVLLGSMLFMEKGWKKWLMIVVGMFILVGGLVLWYYSPGSFAQSKLGAQNNGEGMPFYTNSQEQQPNDLLELEQGARNDDIYHPEADDELFKTVVIQKRHPTIVAFMMGQGCGHCTQFKPIFEEASKMYKEMSGKSKDYPPNLRFLRLLQTTAPKTISHYKIQGFPTVFFFNRGRFIKEFNDERSPQSLLEFIKQNYHP